MKFGELKSWQKKRLLFSFLTYVIVIVVFLAYASVTMYTDKKAEDDYWVSMLQTPKDIEERAAQFDQNATRVQVGTYVENLKEVNLKTSSFRMVVLIWFKWEMIIWIWPNISAFIKAPLTRQKLLKTIMKMA